jgi:hypothetical protein
MNRLSSPMFLLNVLIALNGIMADIGKHDLADRES